MSLRVYSGGKRAPRRPDPDDDYSGVRNPAPVVASANADGTSSRPGCGRKDKNKRLEMAGPEQLVCC
ncbi:MAG: hypothetical protein ACLVJH_01765 [Faecalibacterium prausnitzii]